MACMQHSGNEMTALAMLVSSQAGEVQDRCLECAFEFDERRSDDRLDSRVETLREQIKRLGGTPEA